MKKSDSGDGLNRAGHPRQSPAKGKTMRKFIPNTPEKLNMPLILAGGVILALIVGLIAIRPGDDSSSEHRMLTERVARLESRIAALEAAEARHAQRLDELQPILDGFTETFQRFQAIPLEFEGLQKKIEYLNTRQGNLEKKLEATASARTVERRTADAPPTKEAVTRKTSAPKSTKAFHEVQASETLFSIGQRYGLSVDALRRLNNLNENDIIQPGQRLRVTQ